ncbi:MAG: internal scaffolding protein [Microviridae sp.]|nr:MAG: internal scaffolding protein [Microviridae sp.]
MSNGNGKTGTVPVPSVAYYDFYKTNGSHTVFYTEGPSLTRQEFAEECDINNLMKRYEGHVIGGPGNLPPQQPLYFDFTSGPQTLMEFMDMQQRAEQAFMMLPAVVRKEFDNDALQFVEFASDPANLDQMRTWGLAEPAEPAGSVSPGPLPEVAPAPEPAPAPAK